MKLIRHWPFIVMLFFYLCFTSLTIAALQPSQSFMPVVLADRAIVAGTITLVESDTTFISAAFDPVSKRVLVAYIDRAHGNRMHETELINDKLVEIKDPAVQSDVITPNFVPIDSSKDADVDQFILDGWVWLFVTSRDVCAIPEDCAGTPFKLKLTRFKL